MQRISFDSILSCLSATCVFLGDVAYRFVFIGLLTMPYTLLAIGYVVIPAILYHLVALHMQTETYESFADPLVLFIKLLVILGYLFLLNVMPSIDVFDIGSGIGELYLRAVRACIVKKRVHVYTDPRFTTVPRERVLFLVHPSQNDLEKPFSRGLKLSVVALACIRELLTKAKVSSSNVRFYVQPSIMLPNLPIAGSFFTNLGFAFYDETQSGFYLDYLRKRGVAALMAPKYSVSPKGNLDTESLCVLSGLVADLMPRLDVDIVPVYIEGEQSDTSFLPYLVRCILFGVPSDLAVVIGEPVCCRLQLPTHLSIRAVLEAYFVNLQKSRQQCLEEMTTAAAKV